MGDYEKAIFDLPSSELSDGSTFKAIGKHTANGELMLQIGPRLVINHRNDRIEIWYRGYRAW